MNPPPASSASLHRDQPHNLLITLYQPQVNKIRIKAFYFPFSTRFTPVDFSYQCSKSRRARGGTNTLPLLHSSCWGDHSVWSAELYQEERLWGWSVSREDQWNWWRFWSLVTRGWGWGCLLWGKGDSGDLLLLHNLWKEVVSRWRLFSFP